MKAALVLAATAWFVAASAGMSALWGYAFEPGAAAEAPSTWPEACSISRDPERPTLVVLAHPRCPCTRTTIEELDRLMVRCAGELSAHVLFFRPREAGPEWARIGLGSRAAAIPGVVVHDDPGGGEALRFGATVSGQVLLYDRDGSLRFQGGITAGRGHSGDNEGLAAVVDHVQGRGVPRVDTPVYGCAILGSEQRR